VPDSRRGTLLKVLVIGLAGRRPCPVGDPAEAPDGGGSGTVLDLGDSAAGAGGVDDPVCHRSQASTRRFVCGSWVQIGLPRRVSSIPSTATGGSGAASDAASGGRTWATSEACTMDRSMP